MATLSSKGINNPRDFSFSTQLSMKLNLFIFISRMKFSFYEQLKTFSVEFWMKKVLLPQCQIPSMFYHSQKQIFLDNLHFDLSLSVKETQFQRFLKTIFPIFMFYFVV